MKFLPDAIRAGAAIGLAATLVAGAATAQTRVDAKQDWSIFEAGQGQQKV